MVTACTVKAAPIEEDCPVFDCLDANEVTYLTPSSANWTAYQAPYNLRLSWTPEVIAVPESDAEVATAVKCAAAANLKVQAKGGGHSYASYSSGGQDGSFIIELEKFDEIVVNQSRFTANAYIISADDFVDNLQLPSWSKLALVKDLGTLLLRFMTKAREPCPMAPVLVWASLAMLCT